MSPEAEPQEAPSWWLHTPRVQGCHREVTMWVSGGLAEEGLLRCSRRTRSLSVGVRWGSMTFPVECDRVGHLGGSSHPVWLVQVHR